jgi:hypothetical protein
MSDRLSPEELARLLQEDRERGVYIARTREMAEAQTLEIPPRERCTINDLVRITNMLNGYNVAPEVVGQDLRDWADPRMRDLDTVTSDVLHRYSVLELRLFLYYLSRADYWNAGYSDMFINKAFEVLDVLREKLESYQ